MVAATWRSTAKVGDVSGAEASVVEGWPRRYCRGQPVCYSLVNDFRPCRLLRSRDRAVVADNEPISRCSEVERARSRRSLENARPCADHEGALRLHRVAERVKAVPRRVRGRARRAVEVDLACHEGALRIRDEGPENIACGLDAPVDLTVAQEREDLRDLAVTRDLPLSRT